MVEGLPLREMTRYETCKVVLEGRMTVLEAAAALELSERQVYRIKKRVAAEGFAGVFHKNKGREPHNKTKKEVREKVIELAMTEYAAFNFSHLADMLEEEHKIKRSDETLRRWLRPLGHGGRIRRGKTHHRHRERKSQEGSMLFLDGSPHPWFGPDEPDCCLLLASDDATGKPLWGKFQPAEDRDGCFDVCYHVFRRYGLPASFYLDRASQFTTTRHGGVHVSQSDLEDTQFERAMRELGIAILFANSPQARGRGERLNGSFQNRLVAELAHKGIKTYLEATNYLNKVFIPRYAKEFEELPANPTPSWRSVPMGLDLRTVLCAKHTRTVARDYTVQFDGKCYQLYPKSDFPYLPGKRIEVQEHFDGTIHFYYSSHGRIRAVLIHVKEAQDALAAPSLF